MIIVRGHVLECPSPTVIHRKGSEIPVIDRKGRWNMRGKTVFNSQSLKNWGISIIVRGPGGLQRDRVLFKTPFNGFFNPLKSTLGEDKVTEPTKSWTIAVGRGNEDALMEFPVACQKVGGYTIALHCPA